MNPSFHESSRDAEEMVPFSLVDGEGLGLEHDEVGDFGGFEILEDETSLGERASVHLSGALSELHHVVVLSLELLLVVVAVGLEAPDDLVKGLCSLAQAVVVETLNAEWDDAGQDDVLLLNVHLFLGLLRVLLVAEDVAQLGTENLDGSSLALGDDGESILVDLAGWRDGDVNDDGDFLFLGWW